MTAAAANEPATATVAEEAHADTEPEPDEREQRDRRTRLPAPLTPAGLLDQHLDLRHRRVTNLRIDLRHGASEPSTNREEPTR